MSHRFVILLFGILYSLNILAQSNQYIHFDGVDDYASLENGSALIAESEEFSMTGWFFTDSLAYGSGMMGIRGAGDGPDEFYILQLADGALECRLKTSNGSVFDANAPAGSFKENEWMHIAVTYDGRFVRTYINGELEKFVGARGNLSTLNKPFTIGKLLIGGFNFIYRGRADEITLWSRAIEKEEITSMLQDELTGDEQGLELYYKCNQGVPFGDNRSIEKLHSRTGNGDRDAIFLNMDLQGEESNFGGELDPGYQSIGITKIESKLTVDGPFQLMATATSGLPVSFELISGPASLSGDWISLTGETGMVTIEAYQSGNPDYDAAEPVRMSFEVIDPFETTASIDIRNPVLGEVYSPNLDPILLSAAIDLDYSESLQIHTIKFEVNGESVGIKDWKNGRYTGYWTPPSHGSYSFVVTAINNYGATISNSVDFEVIAESNDLLNVIAFEDVWVSLQNELGEAESVLPSFSGGFNAIEGFLDIQCPPGGCDPWDRVSQIWVEGHDGQWYELIRYLTPYGVACNHEIDLSGFSSFLQGKVKFRVLLGTQGNGFSYNLDLDYRVGNVNFPFSKAKELWKGTYNFGDYANLQPCETINFDFEDHTDSAAINLIATGHGWDIDYNTGNAAEFHEDTHHIWIDDETSYAHHNWLDCDPNPDDCSPQSGTWRFDRAGWCPGAIAPYFNYDISDHIEKAQIKLNYIFNEDYVDLCHPNHPDCVTGVTCANCDQGFNPHLIINSFLVQFSEVPFDLDTLYKPSDEPFLTQLDDRIVQEQISLFPNPSAGRIFIEATSLEQLTNISVHNQNGQIVEYKSVRYSDNMVKLDLLNAPTGVYYLSLNYNGKRISKKIVIER